MRVEISEQVANFVRRLAPDPRKILRAALHGLKQERGDIKSLEGPLKNYCRLRSGGYRIIFIYTGSAKTIRCIYAERRAVIYEVFERMLQAKLLGVDE